MKNNNNDTEVWIYDVVRGIAITIGGGIFFGICLKNFIKFTIPEGKRRMMENHWKQGKIGLS